MIDDEMIKAGLSHDKGDWRNSTVSRKQKLLDAIDKVRNKSNNGENES